jgi:hypothetical protein
LLALSHCFYVRCVVFSGFHGFNGQVANHLRGRMLQVCMKNMPDQKNLICYIGKSDILPCNPTHLSAHLQVVLLKQHNSNQLLLRILCAFHVRPFHWTDPAPPQPDGLSISLKCL